MPCLLRGVFAYSANLCGILHQAHRCDNREVRSLQGEFSFGFADPKDKWAILKALFFPVAGAVTLDDPILDNTLNHKRNTFKKLRIAKIYRNIPDASVNEAKKVVQYGTSYSILASLVPNTHNCQTSVARFISIISKVKLGYAGRGLSIVAESKSCNARLRSGLCFLSDVRLRPSPFSCFCLLHTPHVCGHDGHGRCSTWGWGSGSG